MTADRHIAVRHASTGEIASQAFFITSILAASLRLLIWLWTLVNKGSSSDILFLPRSKSKMERDLSTWMMISDIFSSDSAGFALKPIRYLFRSYVAYMYQPQSSASTSVTCIPSRFNKAAIHSPTDLPFMGLIGFGCSLSRSNWFDSKDITECNFVFNV